MSMTGASYIPISDSAIIADQLVVFKRDFTFETCAVQSSWHGHVFARRADEGIEKQCILTWDRGVESEDEGFVDS
jgi:hypothetical protein